MNLDAHTQAAVDLLDAAGVRVGRGTEPAGAGWTGAPGQSAFNFYAIVWRLGAKDVLNRDLDGLHDERRPSFHVRVVGATASEADQLLDTVVGTLVGAKLGVAGMDDVHMVYDSSITTSRDDDVQPPVYYSGVYLRFWTQETS